MRTTRTHYEVLGLPRGATLTQIKRRYKELVRKFHPDVAEDKHTAHRLFIQITEAYQVLTDPVRKKFYDETLNLEARRVTPEPPRPKPQARPQPRAGQPKHIKDAQWAFIQKRFSEAIAHCKEAIKQDPRNARAYSILGDVYRAQGKISAATQAYSYAVQYDPSDRETEKKLTNLVGSRIGSSRGFTTGGVSASRMTVVNAVGWALAFFLIMLINVQPGKPISWLAMYIPRVSMWSWNLVGFIAGASFVVGALLSINGFLKHPDDEIVFTNTGSDWAVVPAGLILLIGSGFFFPGAAAFYIVVGLIQGSLSRSVLIDFLCVAGIVLLSSLMYNPAARMQVMFFGGNIAFLASLFGWYFGSMFKPLNET